VSLNTVAQRIYHAYEAGTATLDTLDNTWRYYNTKPTDLTITLKKKVASMNNVEKSTYRLGWEAESEFVLGTKSYTTWSSIDQNGMSCLFSISKFEGDTIRIQIYYRDVKNRTCTFYNVTEVSK
jgi:hypothetical protein